jgi:competence protein ComEC
LIHFVSFVAGTALRHAWPLTPRLALAALLLATLMLMLRRKHAAAFMLMAGFALAMLRTPAPSPQRWDNPVTLSGHFSEPARQYTRFNSQPFVPEKAPEGAPESFNVLSNAEFSAGVPYTLRLRMITPRERRNPGAWDSSVYARFLYMEEEDSRDKGGPARYIASLREKMGAKIDTLMPPEEAALVKTVTVGLRGSVPTGIKQDFRRAGLSHLMSISGTHFGFFAVAVFFLIRAAIERLPEPALLRVSMRVSPAQAAALLTIPLMLFYLALSGGSAPSVRAFVMIGFFLLGLLLGARGRWQSFLAAAAFVLALSDPSVVSTPSFLMSFSAVLFIGLSLRRPQFAIREDRAEENTAIRLAKAIVARPLVLTIAATFGVLPFVIHWFHEVSVISPLANILVTGMAGLLLIPLSIAGAVTYASFGSFITAPLVKPLATLALWLTHMAASPSWASIAVPPMPPALIPIYFLFTLPFLITRRRRLMPLMLVPFAAYAMMVLHSSSSDRVSLTMLETGRSDAMVMELPGRRAVVIDTSRSGTEVSAYLRARGIREIEAMVLTHSHQDHTGGGAKLNNYFEVKEVWDSSRLKRKHRRALDGIPFRHLERGDEVELPGVTFRALHPFGGYASSEGGTRRTNNNSLVLRVEADGGSSALLTGDVQADAIAALGRLDGDEIRSDVLKVPHHGKQPLEVRELAEMVRPSTLVLTGYGAEGLDGLPLLSTGDHGAIKVDLSASPPQVKTFVGFAPRRNPGSFSEELRNLASLFTVW